MNTIKKIFNFILGFDGRVTRLHYFIFLLFFFVLDFIVVGIIGMIFNSGIRISTVSDTNIAIIIFLLWIKYSHIVRRFHDFNTPAGHSYLFLFIFLSDVIAFLLIRGPVVIQAIILLLHIIAIGCMIALVFFKGTEGRNDFGEQPFSCWKYVRNKIVNIKDSANNRNLESNKMKKFFISFNKQETQVKTAIIIGISLIIAVLCYALINKAFVRKTDTTRCLEAHMKDGYTETDAYRVCSRLLKR